MRTIVVTGADGLLGRHLLPLLSADRVLPMARSSAGRANVVVADLSRPLDPAALPSSLDAVVYLAQSSRFRDFPEGADDVLAVNVMQAQAMLDIARRAGASHFIYASTGGVYGGAQGLLREDMPAPPPGGHLGFYAASKLAGETLLNAYADVLSVVVLRYFFIYGPGQKPGMLVPRLIANVTEGHPIQLQGPDGLSINPIHVRDAARATAAALDLEGSHIINVAGPERLSLRAMAEAAGDALGRSPVFDRAEGTPHDIVADIDVMTKRLGPPGIRFVDALPELLPIDHSEARA